jgi:hypothetical protein
VRLALFAGPSALTGEIIGGQVTEQNVSDPRLALIDDLAEATMSYQEIAEIHGPSIAEIKQFSTGWAVVSMLPL